uniref:Uncharacterized protein n=1 Tax=viral metagenome TaxID=1070528 RepID=A0A6M3KI25_9ZZZZ
MLRHKINPITGKFDQVQNIVSPLQFKGSIAVAADFPTVALVDTGWFYRVTANVTDNDATKTNTGQVFYEKDEIAWNGTDWTELGPSAVVDLVSTDPFISLRNTTEQDTDGGRRSRLIFRGEQSGGEDTTLAIIQASHDGVVDDEKGDLIFYVNDGNDANAPTEGMRLNSSRNLTVAGNVAGATYGSDGSISDAELLTIDDGATTQIAVGGGVGSPMVWTTATGTGAPVRENTPTLITPELGAATFNTSLTGNNAAGPSILNEASSSTNPTLIPNKADPDSGVGLAAVDQLSLIAGGAEGIRIVEDTTINVGIAGQGTFGTSADKVLAFPNGTAPTTSPADTFQMWSEDKGGIAAKAAPHMRDEEGNSGPIAHAKIIVKSHSATEAATADSLYGDVHIVTGAYTITLPTAVVGMSAVFRATTAAAYSVKAGASDHFEDLGGVVLSAGDKLTSDGTKNASLSFYCESANTWIVIGQNGVFTDTGA